MAPNDWNDATLPSGVDKHALIGKKPNKVIPVPHEFRRHTLGRERDTLVTDIKIRTGCDVIPHWDHGKIYQFDIIGSGVGVEKAVRYINEWISKAHTKSKESSAWAKMPAFDPNKWYYEQVEEMERERKQMFKGPVPEAPQGGAELPSIRVNWPEDLSNQSITPRDVFGNKLEFLDSIRMQDEVFISLLPAFSGAWQIQILGFDVINVDAAESHFLTLIERVRAESNGHHHALNMILDDREGINVVLEKAETWWPNHNDRVVPRLLAHQMMDDPGSFRQEGLHSTPLSKIEHSFQLALEAVRSRKGAYDLAIRLGCLAMSSKHVKDEKVGHVSHKEIFLKEINGMIEIDVKKWLADNELGYQILRRLISSGDFLEPVKSAGYFGYTPASLKQTRPTFKGTWVFRDPTSAVAPSRVPVRHPGRPAPLGQTPSSRDSVPPPTSLFVVQVEWTDDEDGKYEKSPARFYKLEQGNLGPRKNMDINLLELGESRGWSFALESLIPVPSKTVSPFLTGFAERVKMRPKYDISSTKRFAEWDQTPTIKKYLQTGRLDVIYSFGIKKTCYKVEVAGMWYPQQELPVWGLAVRHSEWATHLAELECLPLGERADWGHTISTFLPDNGQTSYATDEESEDFGMRALALDNKVEAPHRDGIRILADKLMQLSAIVSSVTNAPGGVAI